MRAAVYERYGAPEVVELKELDRPAPKAHELLIRVRATTVSSADWRVRSLSIPRGFGLISRLVFGVSKPKQSILGTELAGVIESVGSGVTRFKAGDEVFAATGASMGCHVEYKCIAEDGAVVLKPANLSLDEAAAISFGGTTALVFLRRAEIQRGDSVLINGASGSVGSAAVQLAKHFGAHVTGVCSGANRGIVMSLGADAVIDYTEQDFAKAGQSYDIIMDTAGTAPFARSKHALKDGGRLLVVLGDLPALLQAPWVSLTTSKKVFAGPVTERVEDLRFLAKLAEAGEFKPLIDRRFPFDRIVDAHRLVDSGHKKGNVVVTL